MWDSVPCTRLISTIKEQRSLGALCISLMSGKLALTSPGDIFTESNNGDTSNWSHTPVYLITHRRRDKAGDGSVMLLHFNNSPHQECQYYPNIHTYWHQMHISQKVFIYLSLIKQKGLFLLLFELLCANVNRLKHILIYECLHSHHMAGGTILNESSVGA